MPKRRRRAFTPRFKAQVVLEALAGTSSQAEVARQYVEPSSAIPTGLALETERRLEDLQSIIQDLARGWFRVGTKRDVPRDACYKGHWGDTWVWDCPDGRAALAEFTRSVLETADTFKETQLLTIPTGVQFSPALSGGTR